MEWIKVGDIWLQANLQLIPEDEIRSQLHADDFRRHFLNQFPVERSDLPAAMVDEWTDLAVDEWTDQADDDSVGFWDTYDADLDARRCADLRAERQSPAQQFMPLQDPERARRLHRDADPTHILDDGESEPESPWVTAAPLSVDAAFRRSLAGHQSYGRIARPDPAIAVLDEVEAAPTRVIPQTVVHVKASYTLGFDIGFTSVPILWHERDDGVLVVTTVPAS